MLGETKLLTMEGFLKLWECFQGSGFTKVALISEPNKER